MKSAYRIVLEALEAGVPVEIGGLTLVMVGGRVVTKMVKLIFAPKGMHPQEVLVDPWFHLNDFLEMCAKLPEEKLIELSANSVLNQLNRKAR